MTYKRLDCNLLVFAYRGYSGSDKGPTGAPNQDGIMIDADAIAEYIQAEPRINKDKVFGHGRSLGGAVLCHLAAKLSRENKNIFTGIVVESTFTSISDMANHLFFFLKYLGPIKNAMLKLKWDSKAEVGDITCPILFISGTHDTFVPTALTRELYDTATKAKFKDMLLVEGADHNNTYINAPVIYFNKIEEFYQKCANEPVKNMQEENIMGKTFTSARMDFSTST
jgi:fermentation-respiration switch protein FrsA (DUF1100 family)